MDFNANVPDEALSAQLMEYGVGLSAKEVRYITNKLQRNPTLEELWAFNVEWNEHCGYVSTRKLLKRFLVEPGLTSGPNVIQGPEEDAGIVYFDTIDGEEYGIVIGHESHNHPSQEVPDEGAATGVGGIMRDIFCMGARVIGVADSLRFGDPYGRNKSKVRYIANGVVAGIGGYGNPAGIPNIGGDVVFNRSYDNNCLVNVASIGLVKRSDIIHSKVPRERREPYKIIVVGKPTDKSGFGGATFASQEVDITADNKGAVQVSDPFLKEVLNEAGLDVMSMIKEKGYKLDRDVAFKDFGGGGLYCITSEIAAGRSGIRVDLGKVHTVIYDDINALPPHVIAGAETQERYGWAVPESLAADVLRIYNEEWCLPNIHEGARASVVGDVTDDGRYVLVYGGKVCDVPIDFLVDGISYDRPYRKSNKRFKEPETREPKNLTKVLLRMLEDPNLACKQDIFTTYDTTVQGNVVIAPGEADASLLRVKGSKKGIASSCDNNPFYGRISPYWGAATAVAEAARNVASVGATPWAVTDCLNFGNPTKPVAMWQFREALRGIPDALRGIGLKGYDSHLPVVSGNVSLYNESKQSGRGVDPSPIIFCLGLINDYSKAVTMQMKNSGDAIYLVGQRFDELGGSDYYRIIHRRLGANVPIVRFDYERGMIYSIIDSINEGNVTAAHDISNGGLLVTAAEMAMGGRAKGKYGAALDLGQLKEDLRDDKKLFSESSGFLVEIPQSYTTNFEKTCARYGIIPVHIGEVTIEPRLVVYNGGKSAVDVYLNDMKSAWTSGLSRALR